MEQEGGVAVQIFREEASADDLSEVDIDGDGSSSLSEIEDNNAENEEDPDDDDVSDESGEVSEDEANDSEAETERLEESPHKLRKHIDVVLSSHNGSRIYERSPSKLHQQIMAEEVEEEDDEEDDDEDEEEQPSDGDVSLNGTPESPKSSNHEEDLDSGAGATPIEHTIGGHQRMLSAASADTRKRKRSIMAGVGLDELDEPSRKRKGSIMELGVSYAIDEDALLEGEHDTSNPISGNISGDENGEVQDDEAVDDAEEPAADEVDPPETPSFPDSPKKRGRKKKKVLENGIQSPEEDPDALPGVDGNGVDGGQNGDDNIENEADDEAEAALKNEEELEKKRIALEHLASIERQFSTFRDRLYDERIDMLNQEETMLRQDKPTHPDYSAMMKCIRARQEERLAISQNLSQFQIQTLKIYAKAQRSQILVQYQQEVRDTREKALEQLGKQWYAIQHDRRSYAGSVPDYALKFPTRRSQQVTNQVAYNNEVSILSGIAKYVGFPAAPPMAQVTPAELDEDLEKMGRSKHQPLRSAGLPFQELAAIRSAGSTSSFKLAEEQFIESTPWANPQHSQANLLQRQTSAQQPPRTSSPFSQLQGQPRRHSHQYGMAGPISGTFSSALSNLQQPNGHSAAGGRISPSNSTMAAVRTHAIGPSPLGSRPASASPREAPPPPISNEQPQYHATVHDVLKASDEHNSLDSSAITYLDDVRRDRNEAVTESGMFRY